MAMNPPITIWKGLRVWVVGASTGIGAAIAEELISRGARVALSARKREPLDAMAAKASAGNVMVLPLDVTVVDTVIAAHASATRAWGGFDLVLIVAGNYTPMRAFDLDTEKAKALFDVNVNGVYNVLAPVVPAFIAAGAGHIAIFSSVAGFRGLPQALVYGPSKAALINLAEGLYLDLAPKGIGVHVINPGFVKTPLTDQNEFKMPALISAEEAAISTLRGLERGEFETHFPKRFTRWFKLLRCAPYRWYFYLIHKVTGL